MNKEIKDLKFLVVDDSSIMVRIIVNVLLRIGVQKENILTAENGKEGYDVYKKNKDTLNFILSDWNMPIMNGLDFIRLVRKEDNNIFIIMITTEGGKAEVITALKAGVNNYIVKPFTPQVLSDKLQDMILHSLKEVVS